MLERNRAALEQAREKIQDGYTDVVSEFGKLNGRAYDNVEFLRITALLGSASTLLALAAEGIEAAREVDQ